MVKYILINKSDKTWKLFIVNLILLTVFIIFYKCFRKKCKLIKIFLLLFFDYFLITPKVKYDIQKFVFLSFHFLKLNIKNLKTDIIFHVLHDGCLRKTYMERGKHIY